MTDKPPSPVVPGGIDIDPGLLAALVLVWFLEGER
jgi:hypothetical protein